MVSEHLIRHISKWNVTSFFVRQIYYLCRPRVKWLVTVPIILLVLAHSGLGIDASAQEFVDPSASILAQIKFARVTPAFAMIALAEVLITVSLCILLYHGGSGAAFPSTKRLLNTLIIYAVNRCLLSSLVAIVDLLVTVEDQSTWSLGLSFVMAKLYANSLLASLNSREHLRSRAAGAPSDIRFSAVHFSNLPKLPQNAENSEDRARQLDMPEMAVIDLTPNPALDKTTALQREGEV